MSRGGPLQPGGRISDRLPGRVVKPRRTGAGGSGRGSGACSHCRDGEPVGHRERGELKAAPGRAASDSISVSVESVHHGGWFAGLLTRQKNGPKHEQYPIRSRDDISQLENPGNAHVVDRASPSAPVPWKQGDLRRLTFCDLPRLLDRDKRAQRMELRDSP